MHFHVRSHFSSPFCILLALASSVALVLLAVYAALSLSFTVRLQPQSGDSVGARCAGSLLEYGRDWGSRPSLRSACRWGQRAKSHGPSKGPPPILDGSIHQHGFGDYWEWHIYAAGAKRGFRLRSLGA